MYPLCIIALAVTGGTVQQRSLLSSGFDLGVAEEGAGVDGFKVQEKGERANASFLFAQ